ncbi:hypothetical protein MLD38_027614 [Melastoma candidum]|uniref:Uncharacterized protein n=1 Tax=Melastoma candidum TaxID=119954 RepID=A0ACB9P584_9MYRT|nr:hypothetical protein MLD38_027614 [Melastoma candidum]
MSELRRSNAASQMPRVLHITSKSLECEHPQGTTGVLSVTRVMFATNHFDAPLRIPNSSHISVLAFCDTALTYKQRAVDLVSRMTLSEKVQQRRDIVYSVPGAWIAWLQVVVQGIAQCLHVGRGATSFYSVVLGATSFPMVILSAASFNESLWKNIGWAIARAMYNIGKAGLMFWSLKINVAINRRWRRALDTPWEDPFVVGRKRREKSNPNWSEAHLPLPFQLYCLLSNLGIKFRVPKSDLSNPRGVIKRKGINMPWIFKNSGRLVDFFFILRAFNSRKEG